MYLIAFTCTCRLKKVRAKQFGKLTCRDIKKNPEILVNYVICINKNLQFGGITTLNWFQECHKNKTKNKPTPVF